MRGRMDNFFWRQSRWGPSSKEGSIHEKTGLSLMGRHRLGTTESQDAGLVPRSQLPLGLV